MNGKTMNQEQETPKIKAPRTTTGKIIRRIHDTPAKLGWFIMGALVFLVFAMFTVFTINSAGAREAHRVKVENSIRTYTLQLDAYKDQINTYLLCERSVHSRDDLRAAILGLEDGLIETANNFRFQSIVDSITASRAAFDSGYPALSMASCKVPVAPERPEDIPKDILFVVPSLPEPIN